MLLPLFRRNDERRCAPVPSLRLFFGTANEAGRTFFSLPRFQRAFARFFAAITLRSGKKIRRTFFSLPRFQQAFARLFEKILRSSDILCYYLFSVATMKGALRPFLRCVCFSVQLIKQDGRLFFLLLISAGIRPSLRCDYFAERQKNPTDIFLFATISAGVRPSR